MGARLYNPTVGGFTSVDPMPGGNTTTYIYPQDPVNMMDITGLHKVIKTYNAALRANGRKLGRYRMNVWRQGAATFVTYTIYLNKYGTRNYANLAWLAGSISTGLGATAARMIKGLKYPAAKIGSYLQWAAWGYSAYARFGLHQYGKCTAMKVTFMSVGTRSTGYRLVPVQQTAPYWYSGSTCR